MIFDSIHTLREKEELPERLAAAERPDNGIAKPGDASPRSSRLRRMERRIAKRRQSDQISLSSKTAGTALNL